MSPRRLLPLLGIALLAPGLAQAQGLIVDRRPGVPISGSYEVSAIRLDGRIRDQIAEVQVSQTFHNPGSQTIESEYLFPVPDEGAIQNFVLLVDGKELPGELMDKEKARRLFEEIVRSKRDPALLEYMGVGLIKTSVFPIPPGADRTVTMRYTRVLKRDRDVVEFSYPFATQKFTAKPIKKLDVSLRIENKTPIKSVYSPSHDIEKKSAGDKEATIRLTQRDVVPTRDLRILYTLGEGSIGASVLSYRPSDDSDGYFLVLASPEFNSGRDAQARAKTIVFVLDRSGSMAGKKIEQAREALKFVLRNLDEGDTFNIVAYDDRVETFKPELQGYSPEAREEALRFVDNIRPGGSTNIDGALSAALGLIPDDDSRPGYVLFLTDGLPTAGETNEMKIATHAKESNKHDARVFSFGVGHDVNARLLDRLSAANAGASEFVGPDQDIETSVARFYSRLTSPALTRLSAEISGTELNRTYPRDLPDLFDGGQIVWVGRYTKAGESTLRLSGKVSGETKTFEYPARLAKAGEGSGYSFVEPLWAMRRVGDIIDQIDLNGPSTELTDELVELSKKYGILTPYTSFLADETTDLHAAAENRGRAGVVLEQLSDVGGAAGFGQRENKAMYRRADQAVSSSLDALALAQAATAPTPAAGPAGAALGRLPSLASKPGQGQPGQAGVYTLSVGVPVLAKDAEGRSVLVSNVRQVGKKTFFRRDNRWVDSDLKPEDEAKARSIIQFSDAYFELTRNQTAEENQYLGFTEPVMVRIGKEVYKIDLAPSSP
jgi:Ca-activated chloride channel family protein